VVLCLSLWRRPRQEILHALGGYALAFIVIVGPYLWQIYPLLFNLKADSHLPNRWGDLRHIWWLLLRMPMILSTWGTDVFFENQRQEFFGWAPIWAWTFKLDFAGWVAKFLGLGFAIAAIIKFKTEDALGRLAALTFGFTLLFYEYVNVHFAWNHFIQIWWFGLWGVAAALAHPKTRKLFAPFALILFVQNVSYLGYRTAYLHETQGARNYQFSVLISEQERILKEICSAIKGSDQGSSTLLLKGLELTPYGLIYLARHTDECRGLQLDVQMHADGVEGYVIAYASPRPDMARLQWTLALTKPAP
jgi:hypothetical protein